MTGPRASEGPSAALRERVLAAAASEPSPPRATLARLRARAWAWALAVTGGAFFLFGGLHAGDRPVPFVAATAAGWAAIAAFVSFSVSRGRSMLGRPRSTLFLAAIVTPLALLAWHLVMSDRFSLGDEPPSAVRDLFCFALTLLFAAGPALVFWLGRSGSDPVHPRATAAALAVATGAWASVLIDLHCRHAALAHVAVGHVLPVVALALLGLGFGERLLGVRGRAD
jgi:hypothetical protein